MGLFSIEKFNEIKQVTLYTQDSTRIGQLDLSKFRLIERKNKPLKKVFIRQFDLPASAADGWYKEKIELSNGTIIQAKDYVQLSRMQIANGLIPANNVENIKMQKKLKWQKVPGAKHYQVFIKDLWQDGKTILASKLLNSNEFIVPDRLLETGGYYAWKIHTRDINEDIKRGDFNHGSNTPYYKFSVEQSRA